MFTLHQRHSIFCIVPPRILLNLAKNGSKDEREAALQALSIDHSIRSDRLTFSLLGGLKVSHESLTATPPQKQRIIYDTKTSQELPGAVVRSEGQPAVADSSVNQAYDGLGYVRVLLQRLSAELNRQRRIDVESNGSLPEEI